MMRRAGIATAALVLFLVGGAVAQQVFSGTVLRTDPVAGVIVFDDGRMIQTTADSVIVSGNQRVALGALGPGLSVSVYSGQPVALSAGRYVAITEPVPGTVTSGPPGVGAPPPPPRAVVTAPAASAVVTAPAAGAYEVHGVVARVDEPHRTIQFTDGRRVRVSSDTEVRVENGPAVTRLGALSRGTPVVVRSVRPFVATDDTLAAVSPVASGSVVRVDPGGTVVLSDGRLISPSGNTVVMVNNRPVAVTTLTPGTPVVIYQSPGLDPAASPASAEPSAFPGIEPLPLDAQDP
jgi:hypothetical protein